MRDFNKIKRIVIKIGTNTLSKNHLIDNDYFQDIASQIEELIRMEKQVIIVTSGAIGMGSSCLGLKEKSKSVKIRQACAAIGQPLLMHEYQHAFAKSNLIIAQVLLTNDVFNNRKAYLNLRNSIETLLNLNVIPIVNENDTISTDEIGNAFGDNDKLSALVASKIDADLLIMLSDIDALYDKNPNEHKDAKPIHEVTEITEAIVQNAGGSGSKFATGGMKTKINAAKILFNSGCKLIIAQGRIKNVLVDLIKGKEIGTLFIPKQKLSNKTRWILYTHPQASLVLDEGAVAAIKNRKSLLPSGITQIKGSFKSGDVVFLNSFAKALVNLSSEELNQVIGKHSAEIRKQLGSAHSDVVATPENIVFIED
jgi:glutamate 5-kinase